MQIQRNSSTTHPINTPHTPSPILNVPEEMFANIIRHIFSKTVQYTDHTDSAAFHRLHITNNTLSEKLYKASKAIQDADCNFFAKYIKGASKKLLYLSNLFCKHAKHTKKFSLFSAVNLTSHQIYNDKTMTQFNKLIESFSSLEHIDLSNHWINQKNLNILLTNNPNLQSIYFGPLEKIEQHGAQLKLIIHGWKETFDLTEQFSKRLVRIYLHFKNIDDNSITLIQKFISKCKNLKAILFSQTTTFNTSISFDFSKTEIEMLDIKGCKNLAKIPLLPTTIKALCLPSSIQNFPSFYHFAELEELDLIECNQLNTIPSLPANLKILRLPSTMKEFPNFYDTMLERLDLHKCNQISAILDLPKTLKVLHLPINSFIKKVSDLSHTQIVAIDFRQSSILKEVPPLPSTLRVLHLPGNIQSLPNLSKTKIKSLDLSLCTKLQEIPSLPFTLKVLSLPDNIQEPPDLSKTYIEKLNLRDCSELKEIPSLPFTLKVLTLPKSIQKLPDLSKTYIEKLNLHKCRELKNISQLPATLKVLSLPDSIQKLPNLSKTKIEELEVGSCQNLQRLMSSLPISTLQILSFASNHTELPSLAHTKIKSLSMQSWYKLKKVSDLPSTLEELFLPELIEELSNLSHTKIKTLNLSSCKYLKALPPLPPTLNLKKLYLPKNWKENDRRIPKDIISKLAKLKI